MYVSENGARLVGRRFRRAAWIFGLIVLTLLAYLGAYLVAAMSGIGIWGVFQLAAFAVERVGCVGKEGAMSKCTSKEKRC